MKAFTRPFPVLWTQALFPLHQASAASMTLTLCPTSSALWLSSPLQPLQQERVGAYLINSQLDGASSELVERREKTPRVPTYRELAPPSSQEP